MRYLRLIKDINLRYKPENPNLIGYSDADYGGDKFNRKSTTANVFLLDEEAIFWLSRKQRSISILGCKTARAGPGIDLDLLDPNGSGKVGLGFGFAKTGSGRAGSNPRILRNISAAKAGDSEVKSSCY